MNIFSPCKNRLTKTPLLGASTQIFKEWMKGRYSKVYRKKVGSLVIVKERSEKTAFKLKIKKTSIKISKNINGNLWREKFWSDYHKVVKYFLNIFFFFKICCWRIIRIIMRVMQIKMVQVVAMWNNCILYCNKQSNMQFANDHVIKCM